MLIRVVWVGRTRAGPAAEWIEEYLRRISRFCPIEITEVKDASGRGRGRAARETKSLLDRLPSRGLIVALDEAGKQMTSPELARFLERSLATRPELAFVLGGPEGLGAGLLGAAGATLSLSRLTLTHEMARVVLLEQLYRAFTILKGSPYHR